MAPLAERPRVRAAAIALIRALMAEAGIRPRDLARELQPPRTPGPSPATAPPPPPPPPTAPPLAAAITPPPPPAASRRAKEPARPATQREVAARAPRASRSAAPQLVTPTEHPLDKAARLAGVGRQAVPGVVAKARPLQGEAVVPDGVRVTVCPSGQDMRYRVDPTQPVEGAGFLADWRRRRGGK